LHATLFVYNAKQFTMGQTSKEITSSCRKRKKADCSRGGVMQEKQSLAKRAVSL
jgi:hypothetical protein